MTSTTNVAKCRVGLGNEAKKEFEELVTYFNGHLSPVSKDLTFLLGFYVSQIVRRWWDQYKLLPWPDSLVLLSHGLVNYEVKESVEFFRTIMRYTMLSYILCLRRLSKVMFLVLHNCFPYILVLIGLEKNVSLQPEPCGCKSFNQYRA